ncbi:hypothetical protein JXA85_05200 [Candidatus Woesearchaeota archaeon]|nr:hypothetical protein [Candidatus Woesearchaeota archaeon]
MDKDSKKELTRSERIDRGQVYVRAIIEVLGKPKDYVRKTIKELMKGFRESENYEVKKEEVSKPKEIEGMFSMFVELEFWAKSINKLTIFCFDYMPSSLEIIEPQTLRYSAPDLSGFLNDLQAKLHSIDMIVKKIRQENKILSGNIDNILKNFMSYALFGEAKTGEELARIAGIPARNMEAILQKLEAAGHLKKENNKYKLPTKK